MEANLKQILRSELFNAYSYFDRLTHALIDLSKLNYHPLIREINNQFSGDMALVLAKMEQFPLRMRQMTSSEDLRSSVEVIYKTLDSSLSFEGDLLLSVDALVDLINVIYQSCYDYHYFSFLHTDLVIELPRGLQSKITMIENDEEKLNKSIELNLVNNSAEDDSAHEEEWMDEKDLVLFQVNREQIESHSKDGGSILSFNKKQLQRYKSFLGRGHEQITLKNYDQALFLLEQARFIEETAEVLTLLGWCYSLMNKVDQAKNYCLKAIEVDPDYGPSYNDLGTYLMNEGDLNESLRWYDLAKNAPIYQNREYPFINAGRVYLMQKKYRRALLEFNEAKKRAPFAKNLIETIKKIESLLAPEEKESDYLNKSFISKNLDASFPWEENPLN